MVAVCAARIASAVPQGVAPDAPTEPAASPAMAAGLANAVHVRTQLIADPMVVVPGQTFFAGITLTMDEHWHTYWRNNGDSGQPTSVAWTRCPTASRPASCSGRSKFSAASESCLPTSARRTMAASLIALVRGSVYGAGVLDRATLATICVKS